MTILTDEQYHLATMVGNRLKRTREMISHIESIPELTLWQVLTRFEEPFGANTEDKNWTEAKEARKRIMRWIFPSKWKQDEEPSGKDLTPEEVYLMARWSDPKRKQEFEKEVKAVLAWVDYDVVTPLADEYIKNLVPEGIEKD